MCRNPRRKKSADPKKSNGDPIEVSKNRPRICVQKKFRLEIEGQNPRWPKNCPGHRKKIIESLKENPSTGARHRKS